jgi:FMN hydrolase / 5-amino-6-(5-phospho-D-ribitylamino)uracil phosphatase
MPYSDIHALTLDLDDTLWPVSPVIVRAEQAMRRWLEQHAPATAAAFDAAALRRLRAEVELAHPLLRHDLSALRRKTLQRAVSVAGEPATLADEAFEVFFAARQQVEFFPEALEALQRLAARYPLWSLSNGNADLQRVGINAHFRGAMSAATLGAAKPERRVFEAACRHIGLAPAQVLHVGDDLEMDARGARAAGLATVWLQRDPAPDGEVLLPPPGVPVVRDLMQLVRLLGC